MLKFTFLIVSILLFSWFSVTAQNYILTITNEEGKITTITEKDLAKLKRLTVQTNDHGVSASFEGVLLSEVLQLGGVKFGETMRGKRLALALVVGAADKYQVVFGLSELDMEFNGKIIILADKRDGQHLSEKFGKYRVIVPDEKKQGRWVRQVVSFKIVDLAAANK